MEEAAVDIGPTDSSGQSPPSPSGQQEDHTPRGLAVPGHIPTVTVTPASDAEDPDIIDQDPNGPATSDQQQQQLQPHSQSAAIDNSDDYVSAADTDAANNDGDYSRIMSEWDGPWFNSGYEEEEDRDQGEQTAATEAGDGAEPAELYEQHTNRAFAGDESQSDAEERASIESIGSTAPSDPDDTTYREFSEANTLKIRGDDPFHADQSQISSHFIIETKPKLADGSMLESRDVIVTVGADGLRRDDTDSGPPASLAETPGVPQLVRPVRRRRFPSMKPSGTTTAKSRRRMIFIVIGIVTVAILLVITVVLLVVLRNNGGDSGQQ